MKRLLQIFSSSQLIRPVSKLILYTIGFLERIWSNIKYRALVHECSNSICHFTTEIKYGENIKVGKDTRIGKNCTLGGKGGITIGRNVVLSKFVTIETAGLDLAEGPPYNHHIAKPIFIEDGVWIGTNSSVLSGITIGKNSIIGAGVVVTKDIPANSIIVGLGNRNLK